VDLSGKTLDGPKSRKDWPRPEFVAWHRKQVFRAPEREVDAQCLSAIQAIGISSGEPDDIPHDDPTFSSRWFCDYEHVRILDRGIPIDEIKADQALAGWWAASPFQGLPQRIPPSAARRLLHLIAERDRPAARLLARYRKASSPRAGRISLSSSVEFRPMSKAIDLEAPAKRAEITTARFIRDTRETRRLKRLYRHTCQVCGGSIKTPGASRSGYVEAHHLKPLGREHSGPDVAANILILCPGCHAAFDLLAIHVDPKTYKVNHFGRTASERKKLFVLAHHGLAIRFLTYHANLVEAAWETGRHR